MSRKNPRERAALKRARDAIELALYAHAGEASDEAREAMLKLEAKAYAK